jgi:hypothetical protein
MTNETQLSLRRHDLSVPKTSSPTAEQDEFDRQLE